MKDISQILKSLGLVDSEIKTYLQALQRGPSTVLDLSKYTELSRQATYVAIESLTERGLMSSVLRGKKHYYAAEEPNKLLAYADRRRKEMDEQISDLKRAVPELELQTGGEKPIVRVFEGKEGLIELLNDTRVSKPKQIDEITDLEAMHQVLSDTDVKPYREMLAKVGTKFRAINAYKPATSDAARVNRIQISPKESKFRSHISIHGNKVALVSFEGKMYTILIESAAIAKAMTELFNQAFKKK